MNALLLAVMLVVSPGERDAPTLVSAQMEGGAERVSPTLTRARSLAIRMFAAAGLQLEWCEHAGRCTGWADRIVVRLQSAAPGRLPATARAEAHVFQGRDISIYLDRMPPVSNAASSTYWAHVLVHEITHLLQATDYHADSGVMKAHWSGNDLAEMRLAPLPFTASDIRMIQSGLAYRRRVPPVLPEATR